jgi:hypothetical protein
LKQSKKCTVPLPSGDFHLDSHLLSTAFFLLIREQKKPL